MIVVIGSAHLRGTGAEAVPDGLAGRAAAAAAAAGAAVELVAKVGDDPVGDALLLALARAGVGHVAVLRDGVHATGHRRDDADRPDLDDADDDGWIVRPGDRLALDAADVALALRYLTDFRVVVAVHPSPGIAREAIAAADWAGAEVVLVTAPDAALPADLPSTALVVGVGAEEAVEDVAVRLGTYAAAIDRGEDGAAAFAALTAAAGSG